MNQLNTIFALAAFLVVSTFACVGRPKCPQLAGRWTDHEGQDFIFQPDGKALWLVRFGSSFDTTHFSYQTHCDQSPVQLDMHSFQSGPYVGKGIFGIVEWSSDSSFRLRYEPGNDGAVRPAAFDNEQTLQFFVVH
jgi:hypothetical protein